MSNVNDENIERYKEQLSAYEEAEPMLIRLAQLKVSLALDPMDLRRALGHTMLAKIDLKQAIENAGDETKNAA